MNKLKIIQTPARFYPDIGGVNQYVLDLSEELVKRGNTVKVICANEPKSEITKIKGVSVERLKYIGKIANTNITPGLFFKLIREDFDVIHTHMPTPWSAEMSILASFFKRKPLILTYHNDLIKDGFENIVTRIYNETLLKLLLIKSKKIIITNSHYLNKSNYLKKYSNKIVIIPNGVNFEKYNDTTLKRNKQQIFFISVLDRHHKYKGLDNLIKSIPHVIKEFPNIELIVGGKGELIREYKVLVDNLKISNNVRFLGHVKPSKLKNLYRKCTVFVLPSVSNNEGFGIVLLEAMACTTPVIATNYVGLAQEIKEKECGLIVKPKSSKALAMAIVKILNNPKLARKMGKNGKKLVQENYDWSKISIKVANVYKL